MSTTSISSLDTLPVELIDRILDNLDVETIIFSLKHVCKRLDTIINTYFHLRGYKLNFDGISKSNFVRICHLIKPENVVSLTLSDQYTTAGQIELFLSFFSIERFIRLRSLTLLNIEDQQLISVLKHAITCPLISLSIQEKNSCQRSRTTDALLSVTIERPGLRNLTLTLTDDGTDQIKWPISSTIQHLTLYRCHVKLFPIIFRYFSSLRALVIKDADLNDYLFGNPGTPLHLSPVNQLTSLIMEDMVMNMDKLISILSNTPSLTCLQLTGSINKIDFQWENFIQTKLPLLTQFKFFFYTRIYADNNSAAADRLINPFRTPFWVEIKKWFVTCNQSKCFDLTDTNLAYDIQLYSLPICVTCLKYDSDLIITTSSTSIEMNNDVAVMDSVRTVLLNTEILTAMVTTERDSILVSPSTHLFRKVLNLKIRYNNTRSCDFIQHLSLLIDLSHVKKLTLIDEFAQDLYTNMSINFVNLLEQTSSIHSLVIVWPDETCISTMENFCSIIPHHVKHLKINVKFVNNMKIILNRLEHLLSVTFRCSYDNPSWKTEIIQWLLERRSLTYYEDFDTLQIWLGKMKTNISQQMITGSKRFKTVYY